MLFLAVTLGFLVENQREHYIEHQREKVLARSLYFDIKNDTLNLNQILEWGNKKLNHIDSLLDLLKSTKPRNDTAFSVHAAWLVFVNIYFQSNGTYEQLKYSGSLRYFKQDILSMLNNYQDILSRVKLREEAESRKLEQRVIPFVQQRMNYEFVHNLLYGLPLPGRVYVNLEDQQTTNLMMNEAIEIKTICQRRIILYRQLKAKAMEILDLLKNRYHLEKGEQAADQRIREVTN